MRDGARHESRRVSGAARRLAFRDRMSGDRLDHAQQLAHAVAAAVAAVQCRGLAAAAQIREGLEMGVGQVLDVYVVANAGTVPRRVIRAEIETWSRLPTTTSHATFVSSVALGVAWPMRPLGSEPATLK